MKNYTELSTVVIFAILVHSALTASLVNIFMTLHGVGGGGGGKGEGVEKWAEGDLYFSDALRTNGGDSCSSDDVSSSTTSQRDNYSWLESYNFQQQSSAVAKKKIIVSDYETTISLETYSAMLMKQQRQSSNSEEEEETIESLRLKAKQSKFRYMR